mmetsp:Transcript_4228/g.15968  ORF Transcript_4228/g.15968 Transcript_4228/m.15968 type:complete len:102 (+) Transcript_4228:1784-2089(+)
MENQLSGVERIAVLYIGNTHRPCFVNNMLCLRMGQTSNALCAALCPSKFCLLKKVTSTTVFTESTTAVITVSTTTAPAESTTTTTSTSTSSAESTTSAATS